MNGGAIDHEERISGLEQREHDYSVDRDALLEQMRELNQRFHEGMRTVMAELSEIHKAIKTQGEKP